MCLAVNKDRASTITANNYTIDIVKEFIYLGSLVTTKKISVFRSSAGLLLPTAITMVSIAN